MDQKTDRQQAIVTAEMRRRRRERIIIVATILGIALLTFIETSLFSKETLVPDFRDVAIFGLININIILVILLIFLIIRNIVKLVYERRRGILGSKLRTKLVAAFVTLSLVPTFILFLVATNFLSYSIDNWFNIRVGGALNLSLEVAQNYYQQTSENVKYYADQLSSDITKNRLYEKDRLEYLRSLIEQRQRIFKLGLIEVDFFDGRERLVFKDPGNPDICPLFTLDRIFAPREWCDHVNVECRRAGIGCVDDKKELLKHLLAFLKPIQDRRKELVSQPQRITEIIQVSGRINVDFADVRTTLTAAGPCVMGQGEGRGEKRAVEATQAAVCSPFLEENTLRGATRVLVNFIGGSNMKLSEIREAMDGALCRCMTYYRVQSAIRRAVRDTQKESKGEAK